MTTPNDDVLFCCDVLAFWYAWIVSVAAKKYRMHAYMSSMYYGEMCLCHKQVQDYYYNPHDDHVSWKTTTQETRCSLRASLHTHKSISHVSLELSLTFFDVVYLPAYVLVRVAH